VADQKSLYTLKNIVARRKVEGRFVAASLQLAMNMNECAMPLHQPDA
jgi:hypothetical protein